MIIKNKGGKEKRSGGGKRVRAKTQKDASQKGFGFPGSFRLRRAPTGDRAKTDGGFETPWEVFLRKRQRANIPHSTVWAHESYFDKCAGIISRRVNRYYCK